MTPHLEYSQFIPGICKGRGIGIIDFRFSYYIFDAVGILEALGFINKETVDALKNWFSKFCDWLITSENGLTEDTELNNHGTWYDALVLSIAAFTERPALFKKIIMTAYQRRFKDQVKKDGSQPLELARTMGIIYSLANLRGLNVIANIASVQGCDDFTAYEDDYGAPILKAAIDYIYPYAIDIDSFPYEEIKPWDVPEHMARRLLWLDAHFPNEGYKEKAYKLIDKPYLWLAKPFI